MNDYLLILLPTIPVAGALVALLIPSNRVRPFVLPVVGTVEMALSLWLVFTEPAPSIGWFVLDPVARVVLLALCGLFFCCTLYAPGYLLLRAGRPNRVFVACFLLMDASALLVLCSHQLGLMWVAMEATSLASGPLLYFNQTARSIEATWKYLLVCSVGIALALLGTFFMAYASLQGGHVTSLLFEDMLLHASGFSRPWLLAAFAMVFVGYGTKMGLAPMHTWKPDAYGEAPGIVGAMLAGGVTGCAFVALLRFAMILRAAGQADFVREVLIVSGLVSMLFAAVFMAQQKDFKRMLAYSSVEHMGVLVLGVAIGGIALFGTFLHVITNALTKGVLFLSAANIHRAFGSKHTDQVTGALRRVPWSAALFLGGFIAITGSPPFGVFISEFTILRGAVGDGQYALSASILGLLFVVFIGMGQTVLRVVQGTPERPMQTTGFQDTPFTVIPAGLLLVIVLLLGLYIPGPLRDVLEQARAYFEKPL